MPLSKAGHEARARAEEKEAGAGASQQTAAAASMATTNAATNAATVPTTAAVRDGFCLNTSYGGCLRGECLEKAELSQIFLAAGDPVFCDDQGIGMY